MDKKQVSEILEEMGILLELKGENIFKARAFHNAARIISTLREDLPTLVESEKIKEIKGIGEGLAKVISELVIMGKSKEHLALKASVPAGLLEMIRIQGLGPKRIKILHENLKISTITELKKACSLHRVANLDGFGVKTEENILKGIELLSRVADKHLFPKAKEIADKIFSSLSKRKEIIRCEIAGSLRRRKEIIGDIDIVAAADDDDRTTIMEFFTTRPEVETITARGETKSSVILRGGIPCDLRIVKEAEYPFALHYFTGSKEHNVELRSLARKFGWSLNEYGFTAIEEKKKKIDARTLPKCRDEKEIYHALELHYIPPELRENMGEVDIARESKIPRLIEYADIRGTLHCHTNVSDGINSLEEMAQAAKQLGWEYLGIADHSQSAVYAGGLSPDRVREQLEGIDSLNEKQKDFRIFTGTECDILVDGSLDYPDKLLSSFDYVVASIHSKFTMTEVEATKRIIQALKNKYVTFLGHPTGRLLLAREGYPVNLIEVINAASDYGKGIEINSHPMRLDLDWRFLRYAKEKHVPIYINPDAHEIIGLQDVRFGVGIARKGWLEAKDVVNTWNANVLTKYLQSLKNSKGK
ncbi:MAG: DNA polymerase/3'-5' exonuclease PolX [bacterium]